MIKVKMEIFNEYERMTREELRNWIDYFIGVNQYYIYDGMIWDRDGIIDFITDEFKNYDDALKIDDEKGIKRLDDLIETVFDYIVSWMEYKNGGGIFGFVTYEKAENFLKRR